MDGRARPIEQAKSISVSSSLPTSDAGNATLTLNGARGALFEVTAVSGLTGTVEVKTSKNGSWRQWKSYQYASGTVTERAAGTTITFVAADFIFVPCDGFYAVRIKRTAGTSATFFGRTFEDMLAAMSALGIAGGGGSRATLSLTFARPNDTNAYAAGDVISNATSGATVKEFLNAVRAAGKGATLTNVELILSDIWAPLPQIRMELFHTTLTAQQDNAAYAPTEAHRATCIGAFTFDGINDGYQVNSTLRIPGFWEGSGMPSISIPTGTSLFAVFTTLNAPTPVASTDITCNMGASRD